MSRARRPRRLRFPSSARQSRSCLRASSRSRRFRHGAPGAGGPPPAPRPQMTPPLGEGRTGPQRPDLRNERLPAPDVEREAASGARPSACRLACSRAQSASWPASSANLSSVAARRPHRRRAGRDAAARHAHQPPCRASAGRRLQRPEQPHSRPAAAAARRRRALPAARAPPRAVRFRRSAPRPPPGAFRRSPPQR